MMTISTSTTLDASPAVEPSRFLDLPPSRHIVHVSGCPLYVWWSLGKQCNRSGQQWRCWFLYLEYRLANGASAYVELTLALDQADDDALWQRLEQLPLPGACPLASRRRLICG
jgi:hypothetical protein